MTLRFLTGLETGDLVAFGSQPTPSTGYSRAAYATTKRSGGYSLRSNRDAANVGYGTIGGSAITLAVNIPAFTTAFSPAVTINEGATFASNDTSLTVNDSSGIVVGEMLVIDSEILYVSAKPSSNVLTVARGRYGTAAASHADGATVSRYGAAYAVACTTTEAIDTSETVIDVSALDSIEVNDVIAIGGTEFMKVTAKSAGTGAGNITVVRNRLGGVLPSHATGLAVTQAGDAFCYSSAGDSAAIGDCIVVDSEQMLVTHRDTTNDLYRVCRGINGTSAATHAAATAVNCGWQGGAGVGGFVQNDSGGASNRTRVAQDGGSSGDTALLPGSSTNGELWYRGYLYIITATGTPFLGTTRLSLLSLNDGASNLGWLVMGNAGVLQVYDGSNTRDLFTPSLTTWYRVLLRVRKFSATTGQFIVTIYEEDTNTVKASAVGNFNTSSAIARLRWGLEQVTASGTLFGTSVHSGVEDVDYLWDDLRIHDSQGAASNPNKGWIGPGSVAQLAAPSGTNTSAFDTDAGGGAGTSVYTKINEYTAGASDATMNADYNVTATGTGAQKDLMDMDNYSGANTVTGINVIFYNTIHAVDGTSHFGGIQSGGTDIEGATWNGVVGGAGRDDKWVHPIGATGATQETAWTNTLFDNALLMYRRAADTFSNQVRINAIAIEVEDNDGLSLTDPFSGGTVRGQVM